MEVIVRDDNIDDAIKRLKKIVAFDGILFQVKFRSLYPSLGDRRKAKAARAQLRAKKSKRRREAAMERSRPSAS